MDVGRSVRFGLWVAGVILALTVLVGFFSLLSARIDFFALAVQKAWEGFWYTFGAGLMLAIGLASGLADKLMKWYSKHKEKISKELGLPSLPINKHDDAP